MQSLSNPHISVIVPVYNVATTLNKCVDSILSQDLTNFELILVDDGSTDRSSIICDSYLSIDDRVKVIHKQNGGVSSARNVGLDLAKGEWIAFVDSDDWVSSAYLKNLLFEAESLETPLVITYPVLHCLDGRIIKKSYPSLLVTDDTLSQALKYNYLHGTTAPWGKLYKSEVIRKYNLKFCEGMHIGEDAFFFFHYLILIDKFCISNHMDYNYLFESSGSLTKRVFDYDSEYLGYRNMISIIDRFIERKNIYDEEAVYYLDWIKGYYQRRLLNAQYYNEISRRLRIQNLRIIDFSHYLQCLKVNSLKERFLVRLLKWRLFITYDTIRMLITLMKKYD